MRTLAIAIFTTSVVRVALAQSFWHGTAYGDSVTVVQAKIPHASQPNSSDELRAHGIETTITADTTLAKRVFDVHFHFSKTGLDRVILTARNIMSEPEAEATMNVLARALRERYGKAAQAADLLQAVKTDGPFWLLWKSRATDVLLVPQHRGEPLMVSYTFDADALASSAASSAARKYLKKVNPRLEAPKL